MNDLRRASLLALLALPGIAASDTSYAAKSGVQAWVDIDTPSSAQTVMTSRGETWKLVMSDEFNRPGRDFTAGKDHMWTAMELADGVNAALEYYSINMTSTTNDGDLGVMQIKTMQDDIAFTVYNMYKSPPGFQQSRMYYRSGMVQSWNKFCMQGGRIEVAVKQPGIVSQDSGNPDLATPKGRVSSGYYYPAWPGVWLMGNLGRALFTASTNRMWPWTYNTCDDTSRTNQAISACNTNPGYGLNPGQGRGAPEIDILEGGGQEISSSIQIAPGMPTKFRVAPPGPSDSGSCIYTQTCTATGANLPGVPSSFSKSRGYDTWYQGLRYAPTRLCSPVGSQIQSAKSINASLSSGITQNTCSYTTCPGSYDVNGYFGLIDNKGSHYWGINDDGTCMPVINGYNGAYLCDPHNTHTQCAPPLRDGNANGNPIPSFNYQMDAISANYPIHLAAYTSYLKYQLEWVTGDDGYIRWMLEGNPIFEITADSLTNPPQDSANSNPKKIMIEEPMYMIFNTALSTSWGTKPPNPGQPCRGNGQDATINKICNNFPLYLRIDYIRVWQSGNMSVGCDPATHPTAEWIKGHQQNYEDADNPVVQVDGGATCSSNDDCTLPLSATGGVQVISGSCDKSSLGGRCVCLSPTVWGGPRCTTIRSTASGNSISSSFGPNLWVILVISALAIFATIAVFYARGRKRHIPSIPNGEGQSAAEATNVMPAAMRNTMNEGNTGRSDSMRNRRGA